MASHIPGLDNPILRRIDVALLLDMLNADLEAVLGKDDVLLGHALVDIVPDLGDAEVDLVANEAGAAYEDEED